MIRKHLSNLNGFFFSCRTKSPNANSRPLYIHIFLEMLALPNLPIIKPTKQLFEKWVLWAQLIRVPVASFNTAVKRRFRPYSNILWSYMCWYICIFFFKQVFRKETHTHTHTSQCWKIIISTKLFKWRNWE